MFKELSAKYLDALNRELESFLDREIKGLKAEDPFIRECYSLIKDYSMNSAKRLRPVALILAYLAAGGKDEKKAYMPAVSIELHHTYSLILDDIMDEDEQRRGKPTVYKRLKGIFLASFKEENYEGSLFSKKSSRFAVSQAVMLGNITNILSKKALAKSEIDDRLLSKLFRITEETDELIYHGQMMDVLMEYKEKITEAEYLEMIRLKTSVLFGMAFEIGSLIAGTDEHTVFMMKQFGIISALSFQIQDDIIDIMGGKGHELGSDIKKGKRTLLILKALEKCSNDDRKIIAKILGNQNASENEIKKVISIMEDRKAIEYCRKLAIQKNNEAKSILEKLKIDSNYKMLFNEYSEFLFNRSS